MDIKPDPNINPVRKGAQRRTRATGVARDGREFTKTEAIHKALELSPDVRSEKVAAGKLLLGDVHYPPPDTIHRIANLLASTIQP